MTLGLQWRPGTVEPAHDRPKRVHMMSVPPSGLVQPRSSSLVSSVSLGLALGV